MARIPVYQSQVGIRAGGNSPVRYQTESTDAQIFQQGVGSIVDAGTRLARQQQAVLDTKNLTDFANAQSALSDSLNTARQQSRTGVDYIPAASTIAKQHEEDFYTAHPDMSEQQKSEYALRWAQLRGNVQTEAINWGQGQAKSISVANLEDSAAAVGNTILQNPTQARSLADAHLQAIDQSDLDPATKAQLASRSRNMWALAAAQYGINSNPQHVIDQESSFKSAQSVGAGDGASLPGGSPGTLAVRNNNPLNIRTGNNAWAGKGADNGSGFENFDTADHGFRAGIKLIKNHISNGDNTLSSLIRTWAPASDNNNPAQYAQAVSRDTGIPVDAQLNPNDRQQITSVARAMAKQEGYNSPVSDNQINRAWDSVNDPSLLAPGVPWGQLTPQQTQSVINQAQAKVDQRSAQTRMLIEQQMRNDAAQVEQGIPVNNPVSRESWMATAPSDATPQQIELLGRQYDNYQLQMGLQGVYSDINTKSAADGLVSVQAIKPVGGEENFATKQQAYQQAQQRYQQVISAREKDPGGWLSQNSPDVKSAYAAYAQDPSQGAALAQTIIAAKNSLGIRSKDILPDVMTNSILQEIDNSKEQSVATIQSVGAQFGQYAPQVMEQIQKKAGPVLQVVMATANPRAANALWQSRNVKTTDLRGGIEKPSADSADSAWSEQSKDFAGTMTLQPGGTSVWNNFNEQGKRLTYINVQRGMSPSDAAKQAYQDVLGEQYQTGGTWRMPNKYGLDLRDVSDGADKYLDSLTAEKIMPLIGDPRLPAEVNQQQSISRVKDNAQWVTNSDESGLTLTLNGLLVNGADGHPITVSFTDLSKLGAENRSGWNSVVKFSQTPVTYTPGQSKNYSVESQRNRLIDIIQGGQQSGR
ncbi:transglycosylase SLT domain-containing protein [Phytobacter sp. AG2a]